MQVKSNYTQKLVLGLCVYARGRVREREREKSGKKKSSMCFPSGVPRVLTGVMVGFLWVLHLP